MVFFSKSLVTEDTAPEGGVTDVLVNNRSLGEDSSEMTLNHWCL